MMVRQYTLDPLYLIYNSTLYILNIQPTYHLPNSAEAPLGPRVIEVE